MKMGFALEKITPQKSMLLAGYDCKRWSTNIHDDLYCRIIVIEHSKKTSCFVTFDVLCVGKKLIEKLHAVASKYGIQKKEMIIGAVHTHSGPKGLCGIDELEGIFGRYDEEYMEYCLTTFEQCLQQAFLNMDNFTIKITSQKSKDICSERHSLNLPYDNTLWKIVFNRSDGQDILLYNFSCHPTILHADNLDISADLPGYVNQYLKQTYTMIMFYNGSAGDISTRFTRKSSDFNEIERLGTKLCHQMLNNEEQLIYQGTLKVFEVVNRKMEVKTWDKKHVDSFEKYSQEVNNEETFKNAQIIKSLEYLQEQTFYLPFSIIRLDQCVIITVPSEITSSLTMHLTKKYPCMVFSYTGGYYMYLPSTKAFEEKHYEAAVCMIKKGEGERFIQYIEECLIKLHLFD